MRYNEPKEQTVTLLRLALAQMGQHDALLNPLTFAVFYEHLAGINPRLSEAFDKAVALQPRLDDETVRRLHEQFVAEVDDTEAERIRGDMHKVMTEIAESAAQTGRTAGAFGAKLDGLSGALASSDTASLTPHIHEALAGTQEMQRSVESLRQQVVSSEREIARLRSDLMRTREEATRCPLTRVLNRRGFEQQLDTMLAQPPQRGTSHCLIMIDIDHFKRVNDTHGHVVGDRVIAGLGEVLRSVPTEPGMALARYGGEEFAILLPSATLPKAAQVAESVRARARAMKLKHRQTQEVMVTVTVSAGVAAWRPGEDGRALVSCADAALYRAKEAGRDRVTVA